MTATRQRGETLVLNAESLTPEGTAWLLVKTAGNPSRPVEIGNEPLTIGSDEGCRVIIDDPHVSRRHAEIVRTPAGIVLRDLGSRNGTLVGRIAVKEVVLSSGA
jgi:pSer/pThr/pTyr-binding forkhead associated (FHA) protein